MLNETSMQYDRVSNISPESTSHTHACTSDDIKEMVELISTQNPFKHQPGRSLQSFPSIPKSPLGQVDVFGLHAWLTRNRKRLAANPYSCDDSGCDEADQSDEEEDFFSFFSLLKCAIILSRS